MEDGRSTVNYTLSLHDALPICDTADVEEGGATDTLTVTLTLQTSGSGPVALATDINGITLAGNADYSRSAEQTFEVPAREDTVWRTLTAVNDRLVEGPESFTALLVNTTSNADVTEVGSRTVHATGNTLFPYTTLFRSDVEEGGATDTLTVTLTLQTSGSGPVPLATDINGITLAGNADYS